MSTPVPKQANTFAVLLLVTGAIATSVLGCELIASVDHNKIKGVGGASSGTTTGTSSTTDVTTTATTSTGVMCAAGIKSCAGVGDCPTPSSDCVSATCDNGCCGTTNKSAEQTCTSNSGNVCDGSGNCVACVAVTDCPAPATVCKVDTCTGNACGTMSAPKTTTCNDNGGRICDGSGSCVQCNAATDCPAQTTVCKTNTCSGNTCGTQNAIKGTPCTDSGGVVCDGNGSCVAQHCNDMVKDAGETDVDCGGSCGPCADNKACMVPSDCVNKVCDTTAHTCTPASCLDNVQNGSETDVDCGGTCLAKCADTKHCSANADCANNFCFGSGPGTCTSCSDGLKDGNETDQDCGGPQCDAQNKRCGTNKVCGGPADCQSNDCSNGVCILEPAGSACTSNSQCTSNVCGINGTGKCCSAACTTGGLCGATGCDASGACIYPGGGTGCSSASCVGTVFEPATSCNGAGACSPPNPVACMPPTGQCTATLGCVQCNVSGDCPGPTCSNGMLTPDVCNGFNTCVSGTPSACPGGFICASGTACKTACSSDSDCQSSSDFCQNPGASGTCVSKLAAGATCSGNTSCSSGKCGTSGTGHCCSSAATCPASVPACGATDCNTSGACAYPGNTVAPAALQTPGDCQKVVCNGSGGVTSIDDQTDIPTPNSACHINPACCGPSPTTPCFTNAPTGTGCTSGSDPAAHVCGDTSNSTIAGKCVQCNTDGDCLALNDAGTFVCNTAMGVCQ